MTSYLIQSDFNKTIQDANLQQIISNDSTILDSAILAAEAECKSYLRQKYNLLMEFMPTLQIDNAVTHKAYYRFYLDAATYNPAGTYSSGSLALYQGNVYRCITSNETGVWNPYHWTLQGARFDIFYAQPPFPPFDFQGLYNIGDKVFWKDKVYTCLVPTPVIDHETALQYRTYENLPYPNVQPDNVINGLQYWGAGVTYIIPAYTNPINTTYYTKEDNRDAQMVMYLIDVALFHIHSRIAPRNIPEIRVKRYDAAIEWLKLCATGEITPSLPLLQPKQGNRIRYGGPIKNINTY